ncbi:MAG: tRNA pseudouridine(55) synthase TruB [candidate division WOR-3 bacterium]|nr:tRNA pseudouridine(55) synthase TruB [candidate division WOR-3 bacterium]
MNSRLKTTGFQHNIPSDGVILVDKSPGIRTTELLNEVKKVLHLKKAGHAGTLDPFAGGLVAILYGKTTKLMEYIGKFKEYICTVRLGVVTDTDDPDGEVIEEYAVPEFSGDKIEEVLSKFQGKFLQKVPLYSAVKRNGERLYRKARRGEDVRDLPEREVYIKEIELLDYSLPFFQIRCVAHRGTYMRSLARDIGKALGCGAHLSKLVRIKVEPYNINNAWKLNDIRKGNFDVIPLQDALPHLSTITLGEEGIWDFVHGGKVRGFYPEGLYQVKDRRGSLLGIGKGKIYAVQPVKVFYRP